MTMCLNKVYIYYTLHSDKTKRAVKFCHLRRCLENWEVREMECRNLGLHYFMRDTAGSYKLHSYTVKKYTQCNIMNTAELISNKFDYSIQIANMYINVCYVNELCE